MLFDTGNDKEAFFSNAEKMSINYQEITDVIFSHKHDDHVTGCEEILGKLREDCKVYIPKSFPSKKIPKHLKIHKMTGFAEIEKNVFSLVLKGGFFLYEQALILQTEKGLVIITGCAHPGIINIIEAAQKKLKQPLYLVLGGFHLFKTDTPLVEEIVKKFQSLQVKRVAPCPCSGEKTIEQFQEAYKQDFCKIGTGTILKII